MISKNSIIPVGNIQILKLILIILLIPIAIIPILRISFKSGIVPIGNTGIPRIKSRNLNNLNRNSIPWQLCFWIY